MGRQDQLGFDDAADQRENNHPTNGGEKLSHTALHKNKRQERGNSGEHAENHRHADFPSALDGGI